MKKTNGKKTRTRKTYPAYGGEEKKEKAGTESALDKSVRPNIEFLLSGTVLCVDPSSGSASSQPGYSLYRAGILQEAGTIEIGQGGDTHQRLYKLAACLRDEFKKPDVLVVEQIASVWGFGAPIGIIHLHWAVGAILSSFPCPVTMITPAHWQKCIDKETYPKSDVNDAILLGYCAIKRASELQGRKCPTTPEELHSWVYTKSKGIA